MAKIVIDGRMINESGIGRYLRNLIFHLQKLDKKNEYLILLLKKEYDNKDSIASLQNDKNSNFHKVLADFRWYGVSEQIKLPGLLNKLKPDLVHFPHFNVPIMYRGKFVVTIHDLIHQHYQMKRATTHDPIAYKLKHLGYKTVFRKAVKDSLRILTPSEYVKDRLNREWNINQSKITVTQEAVEDKLITITGNLSQDKEKRILKKFSITHPYIFYVGNAHPHKNVEGLAETFLQFKHHTKGFSSSRTRFGISEILKQVQNDGTQVRNDNRDLQLVLAGNDNYFWRRIKNIVIPDLIRNLYYIDSRFPSTLFRTSRGNDKEDGNDSVAGDIIFTGFISDEELVVLYKNASVFVMPSFEEGFGIPILEAMAFGCPVVSSNAGSLQEVGGDAAIYFNPSNPEDMADKMKYVLQNVRIREELIRKGKMRVKKFSWKKMAEQTLNIYGQVLIGSPPSRG